MHSFKSSGLIRSGDCFLIYSAYFLTWCLAYPSLKSCSHLESLSKPLKYSSLKFLELSGVDDCTFYFLSFSFYFTLIDEIDLSIYVNTLLGGYYLIFSDDKSSLIFLDVLWALEFEVKRFVVK